MSRQLGKNSWTLGMELDYVKRNDAPGRGEEWHLVEAQWLQRWKQFASNAGPNPGPICNWNLLDPEEHYEVPRPELERNKDYKAISRAAWNFLHERYGGGPDLTCNTHQNIYNAKIHDTATVFYQEAEDGTFKRKNAVRSTTLSFTSMKSMKSRTLSRSPTEALTETTASRSTQDLEFTDVNSKAKEIEFVKGQDIPQSDEPWFLIDAAWLQRWRVYVSKSGPHPGSICNWHLLDPETSYKTPRPHLQVEKHYRGISEPVWNFFYHRYGGGPAITSKELNIYASSVIVDEMQSETSSEASASEDFNSESELVEVKDDDEPIPTRGEDGVIAFTVHL